MALSERDKEMIRIICEALGLIAYEALLLGEFTPKQYSEEVEAIKRIYDQFIKGNVNPQQAFARAIDHFTMKYDRDL